MDDYDDLQYYNGDPTHDTWVDYDRYMHTGELSEDFDDDMDDGDIDIPAYIAATSLSSRPRPATPRTGQPKQTYKRNPKFPTERITLPETKKSEKSKDIHPANILIPIIVLFILLMTALVTMF